MEGCSKFCTYCVVPYTRGAEVSRPLDDVLLECVQLVDQGVREITLLGQNVNAYRGAADGGGTCDLALLIHYLGRVPGVERIRFTTSHPAEFTDALADAFAAEPKLAGYLHLPAQSGSDRILAMMKRGYTADQFLARIERVKKARPGISLSSDFIVGFPSETDADHQATMDLIDACGFDGAFSFIYSARPGTPAAALRDGVDDAVKHARLTQLQERIRANDMAYKGRLVGSLQPVLVERRSTRDAAEWAGRVTANRMVNFPVPAGVAVAPGDIVDVRITGVTPNALRGELATPATTRPRSAEATPA